MAGLLGTSTVAGLTMARGTFAGLGGGDTPGADTGSERGFCLRKNWSIPWLDTGPRRISVRVEERAADFPSARCEKEERAPRRAW